MTIRYTRIGFTTQEDGSIDVVIPAAMVEEFKALVTRATNTWPDMHVEIRDFKDRLLGQEDIMGASMKTEIYGYPMYANYMKQQATVIAASLETISEMSEVARRNAEE